MFKRIKKTEDDPSLKEAQSFVKGWVERVVLSTGVLLVDEEATYKQGIKKMVNGNPYNNIVLIDKKYFILNFKIN